MKITDSVHKIGRFVNQYLIIDNKELTLIDTGMKANASSILKYIKKIGYNPKDIKRILITHSDPDHYGAAWEIKEDAGCELWASRLEADAMARSSSSREIANSPITRILMPLLAPMMTCPAVTTERILVDGETLPILGGLQVIASPGHTPGHLSFFLPQERILIAGDAISENKGKPVATTNSTSSDPALAQLTASRLLALKPLVIGCGHAYFDFRRKSA